MPYAGSPTPETDATGAAKQIVRVICRSAYGAARELPGQLSSKALAELHNFCAGVSRDVEKAGARVARYGRDLEGAASGRFADRSPQAEVESSQAKVEKALSIRFEGISPNTKKEIADLVVQKMNSSGYGLPSPLKPRPVSPPNASSVVALKEQSIVSVTIPVKFSSHTDVNFIVDGNLGRLAQGRSAIDGLVLTGTKQFNTGPNTGPLFLQGKIRLDTTTKTPSPRFFFGVRWTF